MNLLLWLTVILLLLLIVTAFAMIKIATEELIRALLLCNQSKKNQAPTPAKVALETEGMTRILRIPVQDIYSYSYVEIPYETSYGIFDAQVPQFHTKAGTLQLMQWADSPGKLPLVIDINTGEVVYLEAYVE